MYLITHRSFHEIVLCTNCYHKNYQTTNVWWKHFMILPILFYLTCFQPPLSHLTGSLFSLQFLSDTSLNLLLLEPSSCFWILFLEVSWEFSPFLFQDPIGQNISMTMISNISSDHDTIFTTCQASNKTGVILIFKIEIHSNQGLSESFKFNSPFLHYLESQSTISS